MIEISAWCLKNNSKDFHCFFNYSGHVNGFNVRIFSGGWGENCEKELELDFCRADWSEERLKEVLVKMDRFKKEHEEFFSKESVEERKAKKKAEKVARLKRELKALEENNHE